jgi:hypothetical protein
MDPFSEIYANTSFALADDATVQFLHYVACEEVTVRGGTVVLTPTGYTVEGGKTDRRQLPCRRETVQQSDSSFDLTIWESGSVLLRGGDKRAHQLNLPSKTVFILTGNVAKNYSMVRLMRSDVVLTEIPAQGRRFEWPENVLKEDVQYHMLFLPTESNRAQALITFVVPPTPRTSEEAVVLIDFATIAPKIIN